METSEYEAASSEASFYAREGLEYFGNHKKYKRPEFLTQAAVYFRAASERAIGASQLARTRKERESQERRVFSYERFKARVEAGLDFVIG